MGNDFVDIHAQRHKPDVVVSMMDTFICELKKFKGLPWAAWQVIDSDPLTEKIADACHAAKLNLSMAPFGGRVMAKAGIESIYVPLCYDPSSFYLISRSHIHIGREVETPNVLIALTLKQLQFILRQPSPPCGCLEQELPVLLYGTRL